MDAIKIGKFISKMRKENNMSQSELANILNVTSQAVSKWENGRGIPDIEMLKKLSEVFKVNMEDILSGEEKKKNNKKSVIYFGLLIIAIILLGFGSLFIINNRNEDFHFMSLATDNDAFRVKGVMAYNRNKKSIYISEVNKTNEDEEKYKSMECILFESNGSVEKLISKYGDINNKQTEATLTELLKGVEFNIDNYKCECSKPACDDLFLRINVKNMDNKVITYQLPIQLDNTCEVE